MRPRIVEFLESTLDIPLIKYLVPTGTTVLVLAIAAVMWIMLIRGKRVGLSPWCVVGASAVAVLCGLLGARAFHLVQHLSRTLEHPHLLLRLSGGTTSWGGYLAGILGFCTYLAAKRQPILPYLDVLASGLALGPLINRWGCLLNGCCYGTLADLPWAVRYPRFSHAYESHLQAELLDPEATLSLPVHPVQIYASLAALFLFWVVSRFWRVYHSRAGTTFAFYWLLFGLFRFFTEFFRGDVSRTTGTGLTLAQHICLGVVVVAAYGLYRRFLATREGD